MIRIVRSTSKNPHFIQLVKLLDADLAERDGADHSFYAQFNTIDKIKYVVVAYENDRPLGSGAIKHYDSNTMEIKRMYVSPKSRRRGIATKLLSALEYWAAELGYQRCVLETGQKQPEAIGVYKKQGYKIIPNYGQYADVANSLCFEKALSDIEK